MEIRSIPLDKAVDERAHWLVRLRWIAGGAVLLFGLGAALAVPGMNVLAVLGVGAAVLFYNVLIRLGLPHLGAKRSLHLQILLDWLALAVLCHFTMGVESPFLPFFIFHVILAAVLMSRRACLRHGLIAIFLIVGMAMLEFSGAWPPVRLPGLRPSPRYDNLYYLLLFLGSFSTLILLTVYLSTTVIQHLRRGEEKLLHLQDDLGAAYDDLRRADEAKTRFVRIVSHEIRSPLAATQSMLRVILEGYAGETSAKVIDFVQRCSGRLTQLLELINELLDLIRGGQPVSEEEKQDILLTGIVTKVTGDLAAQAARKEIRLEVQLEARESIFRGDSQDLERIVLNLVSNAVTYTPEFGQVKVTGRLEAGGFYRLEVRDTGIGIPPDEMPRIFEEFYRASNAKKEKKDGTGLGLAIVKVTVEKYGGRIEVASEVGKGTCFTIHLPVIRLS
jgi:signal transduction histidine kinase